MNIFSRIPWGYYGVWLLPLGGLMGFAGYGAILYTYPVFFPVIIKELGWSAAVAATASSLARLEGGFEGPLVGWIMDKYGTKWVMFVGGLMMGLGLIAMSWMNDVLYYYIVFGVIINLGFNAGLYTASYKAVADWWVKWRARAISIMILPTALAGTFGPSFGTWAIQTYGWRTAIAILGVIVLAIFIPASLAVRSKRPEHYGLLPDGDDPKKAVVATDAKSAADQKAHEAALAQETMKKEVDSSTKQALKMAAFWIYSVASIFAAFAGGVILLFAPSQLMSSGFDNMTAAFYAGLMMSITYVGRLTVMAIGDVVGPKWLMVLSWVLMGLGCFSLSFATPSATFLALGYGIFYGVGYGMNIPLGPAVRGWLFGRGSFGTISGLVSTVAMIGAIVAPTFAGYVYDVTKSYYWAYLAFGVAFLAAAGIFIFAKRPAPKAAAAATPSAA